MKEKLNYQRREFVQANTDSYFLTYSIMVYPLVTPKGEVNSSLSGRRLGTQDVCREINGTSNGFPEEDERH